MDTRACKGLLLFLYSVALLVAALIVASAQNIAAVPDFASAPAVHEPGVVTLVSSLAIPAVLLFCRRR
jgi:hypothetical protein